MPKNYRAPGLELLTCSEAARRLGVSRNYVRKLRRWTGVEPAKVGNGMTLVFTREQFLLLHRELLRRNPGHDVKRPRPPGRPKRSQTFGG